MAPNKRRRLEDEPSCEEDAKGRTGEFLTAIFRPISGRALHIEGT
jgi:hypothetical protein